MNRQEFDQLKEKLWRRPPTPAEVEQLRRYVASHPELRDECEGEFALNRLMNRQMEPVVSSNFTAQVLQAVRRESAVRDRKKGFGFGWLGRPGLAGWLPRAAIGTFLICALSIGYQHHQKIGRTALARNVVELSTVVSVDPQLVEDFEPIRQLHSSQPKADLELLALMQ